MSQSIDQILEQELTKIAVAGAEVAADVLGAVGPVLDVGAPPFLGGVSESSKRGAGHGVHWAVSRLPNDRFQAEVTLGVDAVRATRMLGEALAQVGQQFAGDVSRTYPVLRAVVGAGFRNMNPALVEVEIHSLDTASCKAVVSGTAKEGLIKQHAGEKAVLRLLEAAGLKRE